MGLNTLKNMSSLSDVNLKCFSVNLEKGGVYSIVNGKSKKTDNFLQYINAGIVKMKSRNRINICGDSEDEKRTSVSKNPTLFIKYAYNVPPIRTLGNEKIVSINLKEATITPSFSMKTESK